MGGDTFYYWKEKNERKIEMIRNGDTVGKSSEEIAETFNDYFSNVGKNMSENIN